MCTINVINVRKRRPRAHGEGRTDSVDKTVPVRLTVDELFSVDNPRSLAA